MVLGSKLTEIKAQKAKDYSKPHTAYWMHISKLPVLAAFAKQVILLCLSQFKELIISFLFRIMEYSGHFTVAGEFYLMLKSPHPYWIWAHK